MPMIKQAIEHDEQIQTPRCRWHDCGGTSSNPGTAGLSAWPYTWPRWSA